MSVSGKVWFLPFQEVQVPPYSGTIDACSCTRTCGAHHEATVFTSSKSRVNSFKPRGSRCLQGYHVYAVPLC